MPSRPLTIAMPILVLAALLIASPIAAQLGDPYIVRVPYKGPAQVRDYDKRGIDVLALNRDATLDLAVDAKELDRLMASPLPVSVVGFPGLRPAAAELDANLGLYHTYAEMEAVLSNLVLTYPAIAKLDTIGTSIEGREIYMLKISDNVASDESEPEVLYMGNHHARELMSVEIPLRFAMYLLENYGIDSEVTDYVNEREIFVAPMINPDGHVWVQNNHGGNPGGWWRKNRRDNGDFTIGVDLNRNYGYGWGYDDLGSSPQTSSIVYRGSGPFSEPETQAVRDFFNNREIILSFSYHSYGELLLLPPGFVFDYTPEHDVYVGLGNALAASNGYFVGNPAMGAIYITNGDSDDWIYYEQGTKPRTFGFTPEVNSLAEGGFGPPDTLIQPTFDLLLPMNLALLEYADNPFRVIGPRRPTLLAVDTSGSPQLLLSWTVDANDPNVPVSYDIEEYKNLHTIPVDDAESASPLWDFDGFAHSTARAFEGSGSYYSGTGDNLVSTLAMETFLPVPAVGDTMFARLWYDIETDWDYAYLQVSDDGGLTWGPVEGNVTTSSNPFGNNRGHGITGSSGGWVEASFPLDAYGDQDILLRFQYQTDGYIFGEGIYVDVPGPVATYDSKRTVVSDFTGGTSYLVLPPGTGDYAYTVRSRDAEGDTSYWSTARSATVTVATGLGDAVPDRTALDANHPNPFNPATTIPYSVGGPARTPVPVSLVIFNVAGERIATLVDRMAPPGRYRAVWRGVDGSNQPVASGVYFARLVVDGRAAPVRKLVLLK